MGQKPIFGGRACLLPEELNELVDYHPARGLALAQFIFWANTKTAEKRNGWMWKSARDLSNELFGYYKETACRSAIQWLVDHGWLEMTTKGELMDAGVYVGYPNRRQKCYQVAEQTWAALDEDTRQPASRDEVGTSPDEVGTARDEVGTSRDEVGTSRDEVADLARRGTIPETTTESTSVLTQETNSTKSPASQSASATPNGSRAEVSQLLARMGFTGNFYPSVLTRIATTWKDKLGDDWLDELGDALDGLDDLRTANGGYVEGALKNVLAEKATKASKPTKRRVEIDDLASSPHLLNDYSQPGGHNRYTLAVTREQDACRMRYQMDTEDYSSAGWLRAYRHEYMQSQYILSPELEKLEGELWRVHGDDPSRVERSLEGPLGRAVAQIVVARRDHNGHMWPDLSRDCGLDAAAQDLERLTQSGLLGYWYDDEGYGFDEADEMPEEAKRRRDHILNQMREAVDRAERFNTRETPSVPKKKPSVTLSPIEQARKDLEATLNERDAEREAHRIGMYAVDSGMMPWEGTKKERDTAMEKAREAARLEMEDGFAERIDALEKQIQYQEAKEAERRILADEFRANMAEIFQQPTTDVAQTPVVESDDWAQPEGVSNARDEGTPQSDGEPVEGCTEAGA